ncbi:DUF6082 family protein [Micromonospora sp. WMMD1120]|uniref:DUF6082 family protein n=1 Tax=Micromonospora sp. WMMD1120 TaxID=3016106 RepID=UPI002417F53B|nr:DUF6082 family protein [Micromonospora sp. WMMD1120]MDG4808088.1 DUF6082 family protein [Micromonospora sp. WMMD1120]
MVSDLARRSGTPTILLIAVLAMLAAVLFSPAVLLWVGRRPGYDWALLGNVGETYGAASAILAALALVGVVSSLVLQARETKAAREQALRALHTDLLKMGIDDPALLECWGPIEDAADTDWFRKHVYANLIVTHWQLMWEVDVLSAPHLEVLADQFFRGQVGRRFWTEARGPRSAAETSRRARRFTAIVDSRYLLAVAAGPAENEPRTVARPTAADQASERKAGESRATVLAIGAALVAAAVIAGRYRRRGGGFRR